MITLINYGSGNIYAIANIYKHLNIPFRLSNDPEEILQAQKLILPGVGDYDETMALLENNGVKRALNEAVLIQKIPILGVCVGMQIMGEYSDEGIKEGFGWIPGRVRKLKPELLESKPHLPHLGWNSIEFLQESSFLKILMLLGAFTSCIVITSIVKTQKIFLLKLSMELNLPVQLIMKIYTASNFTLRKVIKMV